MPVHLHKDLERLKKIILEQGTIIEENIARSVTALSAGNRRLAEQIIAADEEVDQREVQIEEECLKILALHQPVARDLRFVVTVLKMNNDLERMGDYAVNMAERVIYLANVGPIPMPRLMHEMADKAAAMVRHSLDSLVDADPILAQSVILADDDVDRLRDDLFTEVLTAIRRDLDHLEQWVQMLSAGRYLERIADLATNVAQDVVYLVEGELVRHTDFTLIKDPDKEHVTLVLKHEEEQPGDTES